MGWFDKLSFSHYNLKSLTERWYRGSKLSQIVVSSSRCKDPNSSIHSPNSLSLRILSQPYNRNRTPKLLTSSGKQILIKCVHYLLCLYIPKVVSRWARSLYTLPSSTVPKIISLKDVYFINVIIDRFNYLYEICHAYLFNM